MGRRTEGGDNHMRVEAREKGVATTGGGGRQNGLRRGPW
jgi:hypothetical protein